jgi:hypothetical protein
MNITNTNTNHTPRIRPRTRIGENTSTGNNAPFSQYVLFPPNTSTSSTTIQNTNPFIFQSGIPAQNLVVGPVLAQVPSHAQVPAQVPAQDVSSSIFNFSFPIARNSLEEEEEKKGEERYTAFNLTILETETHKKKKMINKWAKVIEAFLEEKPDETTYCLSRYTLFEIDGIQADVYIGKESESYYYHFVARNIEYFEDEDGNNMDDSDFMLLEKNDFDTVVDVLEHIEKVRETYTFLDFYLLSQEKKEVARNHRAFMPISQDKICSVCYEPTLEYTTCKHPICLKCREKCIVNNRKMCPVCRSSQLRLYPTELAKL